MDASNNGLMLTRYYQNLNYFGHIQTENFNSSALVCSRVDVTLNQALNKVYKLGDYFGCVYMEKALRSDILSSGLSKCYIFTFLFCLFPHALVSGLHKCLFKSARILIKFKAS